MRMLEQDNEGVRSGNGRRRGRAWGLLLRVGLASAACVALAALASSCSLIVSTSGDQCAVIGDCATFPGVRDCVQNVCTAVTPPCSVDADCSKFKNTSCAAGVCAKPTICTMDSECSSLPGTTCKGGICLGNVCTTNAQCTGTFTFCRKDKKKCVSLVNDLCTTVAGTSDTAYKDDNAVIFGSILPTVGPDAPIGILDENAAKLALDEFGKTTNGILGLNGGSNRPLVLVGCNDGMGEDKFDDAAKHLIDDIGVPAILGYAFSGNTIKIATDVAIPAGVLVFSPSATSPSITDLADKDLVWRTSPSDLYQAAAQVLYYPKIEAAARARYNILPGTPIKVAVVNTSDPGGANLADALQAGLSFNGMTAAQQVGTNYLRVNYGDPGKPDLSKVNQVVTFAPNITFIFGYNEGVDPVLKTIEAQWSEPSHRSFFFFSDAGEVPDLWNKIITTEDLRTRIIGTAPGTNTSWAPYATFRTTWFSSKYASSGSPDNNGVAGSYDIMYMLAYAAVAVGSSPMTGTNLVKYGLRNMEPTMMDPHPPQVDVGPPNISSTFTKMAARARIDFQGASGPLDFDIHGDVVADIQVWCVPPNPGSGPFALPAINSGAFYDSTTKSIKGSYVPECKLP